MDIDARQRAEGEQHAMPAGTLRAANTAAAKMARLGKTWEKKTQKRKWV